MFFGRPWASPPLSVVLLDSVSILCPLPSAAWGHNIQGLYRFTWEGVARTFMTPVVSIRPLKIITATLPR